MKKLLTPTPLCGVLSWLLLSSTCAMAAPVKISTSPVAVSNPAPALEPLPIPQGFFCSPNYDGLERKFMPISTKDVHDAQDWQSVITWYVDRADKGSCKAYQALGEIYYNHVDARTGQMLSEADRQDEVAAIPYLEVAAMAGLPRAEYELGKIYSSSLCQSDAASTVERGLRCLKRLKRSQNYFKRALAHTPIPRGLNQITEPNPAWFTGPDEPEGLDHYERSEWFEEHPPVWHGEAWYDYEYAPIFFGQAAMQHYFEIKGLIKRTQESIHDLSVMLAGKPTNPEASAYLEYQPKQPVRNDAVQLGPHQGVIMSKSDANLNQSIYSMVWHKLKSEATTDPQTPPWLWDVTLKDVFPTSARCERAQDEKVFVKRRIKRYKNAIKDLKDVTDLVSYQRQRAQLIAQLKKLANGGSCRAFFYLGKLHATLPVRNAAAEPQAIDYTKVLNFTRVAAQAEVWYAQLLMAHYIDDWVKAVAFDNAKQVQLYWEAKHWSQQAKDCYDCDLTPIQYDNLLQSYQYYNKKYSAMMRASQP